jgi:Tol biopolymer transport system component
VGEPRPRSELADLLPGTSELLVMDWSEDKGSLWVVSLLGNFGRRVGEVQGSSAAWSPDGNRVVYAKESDLYVVNRDGTGAQKLISLPAPAACLRWSPDGTKLRFIIDDPRPLPNNLWEVGSDGRGLHPLLPGWSGATQAGCGNWTPDGRYFFFESANTGGRDIWVIREKNSFLGMRGPRPVQLTSGPLNYYSPTPSRDGSHLFVVGELRRGELTRYDENSKQFVPFLNGISANDLQFSHDGKWVAYVTYPERAMWKSRIDGTERLQLTAPPMRAFLPVWSPDDKCILFFGVEKTNRAWKIYAISPAGGAPEMLLPDEDSQEAGGTWSPDGESIVYGYSKMSAVPSPDANDIRVLERKSKRTRVLPGSEGLYAPQWSPDGRFVAALVGKKDYLVLYDTTTQKWRPLLAQSVGYPGWSRDGQYIYCNTLWREGSSLVRVTVASGEVESFPINFNTAGTFGSWTGSTPDGSFLLLRDLGSRDIYSLDIDLP